MNITNILKGLVSLFTTYPASINDSVKAAATDRVAYGPVPHALLANALVNPDTGEITTGVSGSSFNPAAIRRIIVPNGGSVTLTQNHHQYIIVGANPSASFTVIVPPIGEVDEGFSVKVIGDASIQSNSGLFAQELSRGDTVILSSAEFPVTLTFANGVTWYVECHGKQLVSGV